MASVLRAAYHAWRAELDRILSSIEERLVGRLAKHEVGRLLTERLGYRLELWD